MIVDGVGLTLIASSAVDNNVGLAVAGGITYGIVPMLVHFGHRRFGVGVGSWGIRVGMPFLGALIATRAQPSCSRSEDCWTRNVNIGLFTGFVGAAAIDAGLLAWERHRPKYPFVLEDENRWTLSPAVSFEDRTFGLDVHGTW